MKHEAGWIRTKIYDLANNIVAGAAWAAIATIVATLYTRFGLTWAKPIINGAITFFVVFGSFFIWKALLSLPSARQKIGVGNVGVRVLEWLHRFNLEVKNVTDDESFFSYRVRTDGGKIVVVTRSKKTNSDYLIFRAFVTLTESEKHRVSHLNEEQKRRMRATVQLELARAVIGYKTDNWLEGLTLFKQIPISEHLNEATVITTIWEIEATVSTLFAVSELMLPLEGAKENGASNDDKGMSVVTGSTEEV